MSWLLITATVCGSFSAGALFGTWWRSAMHSADRRARKDWEDHFR